MPKSVFVACAALLASPVQASIAQGDIGATPAAPIDMLYPEIAVDDDGWRGLLPVILYNTDELANPSQPGTADQRSERDAPR
jgi:hypothetical protein